MRISSDTRRAGFSVGVTMKVQAYDVLIGWAHMECVRRWMWLGREKEYILSIGWAHMYTVNTADTCPLGAHRVYKGVGSSPIIYRFSAMMGYLADGSSSSPN